MIRIPKRPLALLLLLSLLLTLTGCSEKLAPKTAEKAVSQTAAEEKEAFEEKADLTYPCDDGSLLSSYSRKTKADFDAACKHLEKEGYTLYSASDSEENPAKTYTKGHAMTHVYYHATTSELNLLQSEDAADTLPPATPAETGGSFPCTVTQLSQSKEHDNGMGYVIQLSDGSFILYDGGYGSSADELLSFLQSKTGGEKPVVRAWLLTHLHLDHIGIFLELAQRENVKELITLEHLIYSPVPRYHPGNDEDSEPRLNNFDNAMASFPDTKLVYAHTGMRFTFCNLTMEILYTPESLYKRLHVPEIFNNSSILSRLKDDKGSALFTGDLSEVSGQLCVRLYGDALASDMVQMAHHGTEPCPLSFYQAVKPSILWYPCPVSLYTAERNAHVKQTLANDPRTKEILIAGNGQITRPFPAG